MLTNMLRVTAFCLAAMPLVASAAGMPAGSAMDLAAESPVRPEHVGGTDQRVQSHAPRLRVAQAPAQYQHLYGRRRDRNVAPLMSHATPMSQQRAATVRQQILVRQHQIQQQRRQQQFQQWQRTSQAIEERHQRLMAIQAWRAQQQQLRQQRLTRQQIRILLQGSKEKTHGAATGKIVSQGQGRRIRRR